MATNGRDVVWPKYLNPYSMELRFQASAAAHAFKALEERIAERKRLSRQIQRIHREGGPPPLEMEQRAHADLFMSMFNLVGPILGDIQSFMAALGIIASILWPSKRKFHDESDGAVGQRVARGAEIRKLLGVSDDSILKSRTGKSEDIRGGLLHFDEMIDEFQESHREGDFVSFDIGSSKLGTAIRRNHSVRWLDEDTLDLWINDRRGNLRELREELGRSVGRIKLLGAGTLIESDRREGEPFPFGVSFGVDVK